MLLVHCLFDYNKHPPKPLVVGVYDGSTDTTEIIELYLPRTGKSLAAIIEGCTKIRALFDKHEILLSDFNAYVGAFSLDTSKTYQVYDMCIESLRKVPLPTDIQQATVLLGSLLGSMATRAPEMWQPIIGNAQLVYQYLGAKGVTDGVNILHPVYGLTFSGRSKTSGFNIQGATESDIIKHVDVMNNTLIHLDWIAADIRVAGLMSNDHRLNESFISSDPYTYMAKELDHAEVTRDKCKRELLSSLYALNPDNPTLDFYGDLQHWMKEHSKLIKVNGYAESLLGRKFWTGAGRSDKSVFNAIVQGSVAHAMQLTLYRLFKTLPIYLVTEIHDSVVLACEADRAGEVIKKAVSIMRCPFEGVIEENPIFPVRVSVGVDWKQWKLYKVFR